MVCANNRTPSSISSRRDLLVPSQSGDTHRPNVIVKLNKLEVIIAMRQKHIF